MEEEEDETELEDLGSLDDFSDLAIMDGVDEEVVEDMTAETADEIVEEEITEE